MTLPVGQILFDTNILVHLVRRSPIGRRLEPYLEPESPSERPMISIVTIGEALALSRRWSWGSQKIQRLDDMVKGLLVVIDIDSTRVVRNYAELENYLRGSGRSIQQNDLWIAATTIAVKAHLLTTDKDFDPLHPHYLRRTWIDPLSFQ